MENRSKDKIKPYERFGKRGSGGVVIEATELKDSNGFLICKVVKSAGIYKMGHTYYMTPPWFYDGHYKPLPAPDPHPLVSEVMRAILEEPNVAGQLAKAGAIQYGHATPQTKEKIIRIFKDILPRELVEEIADCPACGVPY